MFSKEKGTEKESILHSDERYFMKLETNSTQTQHSSFPWEVYFDDMHHLEEEENKRGKAFILFPNGFLMIAFDESFGEDLFKEKSADEVPGFIDSVVHAFTFRKDLR